MAKGRHISKRRTRAVIIVAVVAGILVLAVGGAAYAGLPIRAGSGRHDPSRRDHRRDRRRRHDPARSDRRGASRRPGVCLSAPITVKASGKTWTVTPQELGRRANVVAAVNRALGPERIHGDLLPVLAPVPRRVRSSARSSSPTPGTRESRRSWGRVAKDVSREAGRRGHHLRGRRRRLREVTTGQALDFPAATKTPAGRLARPMASTTGRPEHAEGRAQGHRKTPSDTTSSSGSTRTSSTSTTGST